VPAKNRRLGDKLRGRRVDHSLPSSRLDELRNDLILVHCLRNWAHQNAPLGSGVFCFLSL
jgi:hypothetical protein